MSAAEPAITSRASVRRQSLAKLRLARRRRSRMVLNMTPLIDMTFLLLIFFVVSSNFDRPEGRLMSQMPPTQPTDLPQAPISPIIVRISSDAGDPRRAIVRIEHLERDIAGFDVLYQMLENLKLSDAFDENTPVIVASTENTEWDHVVNGWNAAVRAGFRRIAFAKP